MAVRVSMAAANIAGISFAGKSPRWVPNWPSLSGIDQKTLEDIFDPRHVEEYVRGDLPPSMVRKFDRRKRRVDDLVDLLRYAWARKLEHVSELARLTHEKELHSAVSAALSVSTDVAEGAEGEPGLLGPTPAEEFFFLSPPGAVNAAPLTGVIIAAPVTGITGTAGPPSDVQVGPTAIHGTRPHPAVAGAVVVSLVLFVVGAAIWAGRRFVTVVRRRRQVAVMKLEKQAADKARKATATEHQRQRRQVRHLAKEVALTRGRLSAAQAQLIVVQNEAAEALVVVQNEAAEALVVVQNEAAEAAREANATGYQRQRGQIRHLATELEAKQKQVEATSRALAEAQRDGEQSMAIVSAREQQAWAGQGRAWVEMMEAEANARQLEGQVQGLETALEAARRETAAGEAVTVGARAEAEELRRQLEETLQAPTERQREADSSSVEVESLRTERDDLRLTVSAREQQAWAGQGRAWVEMMEAVANANELELEGQEGEMETKLEYTRRGSAAEEAATAGTGGRVAAAPLASQALTQAQREGGPH